LHRKEAIRLKMRVYRCLICGDAYVGYEKPTNCPFCGAHEEYLVEAAKWEDRNKGVSLTEISKKNLEKALELEMSNSAFYRCAAENATDIVVQAMFKALAKIEAEHASTICKVLGIPKPDISKVQVHCSKNDIENLKESTERETRASNFYAKAGEEATEPRVKELFMALVEIEKDHLDLDHQQLERLGG
jgi:rubrerythrin